MRGQRGRGIDRRLGAMGLDRRRLGIRLRGG